MKTTGFSRVSKDLIIKEIQQEIKQKSSFFVSEHATVSASAMDKLRAKLRQSGSRYIAVKKSLGKKALENSNLKEIASQMDGACGITFTSGDVVVSSKILVDFAKDNASFKIQNGYMNGQIISASDIKALASLPAKEVLIARVVGGVAAPISRFVGVLSGTIRKVVNVLDAVAKKKGNG